jgi:hypothetical protein
MDRAALKEEEAAASHVDEKHDRDHLLAVQLVAIDHHLVRRESVRAAVEAQAKAQAVDPNTSEAQLAASDAQQKLTTAEQANSEVANPVMTDPAIQVAPLHLRIEFCVDMLHLTFCLIWLIGCHNCTN